MPRWNALTFLSLPQMYCRLRGATDLLLTLPKGLYFLQQHQRYAETQDKRSFKFLQAVIIKRSHFRKTKRLLYWFVDRNWECHKHNGNLLGRCLWTLFTWSTVIKKNNNTQCSDIYMESTWSVCLGWRGVCCKLVHYKYNFQNMWLFPVLF